MYVFVVHRQSVHIGYTDFSEDEVRRLVAELGKQFRGDRYIYIHLILPTLHLY